MADPSPIPISRRGLDAAVDRLIMDEGRLDPFELMIALDLLAYADYQSWRMGQRPEIESALAIPTAEAVGLLEQAGDYARRQGLQPVTLEPMGWGAMDQALSIGRNAALVRLLALAYAPREDRHQLDLFHDAGTLPLENEIRQALCDRRVEAARSVLARLMQQAPGHRDLHGFLRLIQAADELTAPTPEGSPVERPSERLAELESIGGLARQVLGRRARDFMDPLWCAFAEQLAELPFDPARPDLHAVPVWARIERWQSVRQAVESEPDWRDEPGLILAHAEACRRTRDAAAAMGDWMWLCWEHPDAAERALDAGAQGDAGLAAHWNTFLDLDPELPVEDFPAWLLLRDRALALSVPPEPAPQDERGEPYRLIHRLVTGDDSIDTRRALAEAHPELLRLFLASRS